MTIGGLKDILGRKFRGTSLDDVASITDGSLFKEAASNLLTEIDPDSTVRRTPIEVFRDVFDYAPPTDIKDIVDIRPQSFGRLSSDNPTKRFSQDFDIEKRQNDFTLETYDTSRVLRYVKDIGSSTILHGCESLTSDGTWSAVSGGSNIATSTVNPYRGGGSIQFDIGATGGSVQNSTFTAVDLSSHKNKSTLFAAFYIPDATLITSVALSWGSSSGNYFSRTRTAPQFGAWKNGWNLVPFAWNGATETGSVTATAINFLKFTVVSTSSDTDLKIDHIFSALGRFEDLHYYSSYLFRSSATAWLETPTADSNSINLNLEAENLFVYECIRLIALQLQGNQGTDYVSYTNILYGIGNRVGLYERYRTRFPDEPVRPQAIWRKTSWTRK